MSQPNYNLLVAELIRLGSREGRKALVEAGIPRGTVDHIVSPNYPFKISKWLGPYVVMALAARRKELGLDNAAE